MLLIVAAACGKPSPTPAEGRTGSAIATPAPAAGSAASPSGCEQLPFAPSNPVPEASGAGWMTIDGKLVLVVVSDSGNDGEYGLIDPETGATRETGKLPLDGISDDVEGVSVVGDKLYGLTSSGWMLVWQRQGKGFVLVGAPYALGPVDLPDTTNNSKPPKGEGMVCGATAGNCGRNYEGLCLLPTPPTKAGSCVGFAAAKADGTLYCLTDEAGKLVVHRDRRLAVEKPGALADCAFDDRGRLWIGDNLFGFGAVSRVVPSAAGWDDLPHAQLEPIGDLAIGFPEVIAVRGDFVYRMSDMGGAPSMQVRYRCP